MGIMRWAFYNRLKEKHPDAGTAYGYTAKNTRIRNGLEKNHAVDARCTCGNPESIPLDAVYMQKAAGKRNRQIHKATINKGGKRKLNQSPKYAFGIQLFGRVQLSDGRKGFIFGRRKLRRSPAGWRKAVCGNQPQKTQAFREAQNNTDGKEHAASSPCLKAGVSAA
ncbi:MAG: hypothetical protein LBU32_13040 [Clostridiales bacterium]|nr:hypothetical protein [Clostridiales bacterium]